MSEIPYSVRSGRTGGTASINNITGLDWANVDDNEIIRRKDATTGEGAGFSVIDTTVGFDYKKTLNFYNRVTPINIPLGVIEYFYDALTTIYKTHISPKSTHIGTSNGMFLQATRTVNKVKVGINSSTPSKDLEVGTTLIVDDLSKYVGINTIPTMDLEILNTFYANSTTRRVGIINAAPTTTFQVGTTTFTVNDTTGRVGIGITDPDEELEVDGSIQIDSATGAKLKFQKSGASPHALGEVDGVLDGFNGGRLEFHTKIEGGAVTEKLRINNKGAIGIGGTTYGNPTQVLSSNGYGSSVSWEDAPKSRVYGTSYLDSNDVPYNTANAYQTLARGTWAAFGTPSHTTLFPASVTTAGYLVKFPRAGTYNVSVSCQTLGNYPGNATRVLRVQTTTPPSASWVDAKTHQHNEGFGVANDFVYTYTNTINVVIEVTQPDTTLRAMIYMSSVGRIDGNILNNGLQQKPTSISIFNVD